MRSWGLGEIFGIDGIIVLVVVVAAAVLVAGVIVWVVQAQRRREPFDGDADWTGTRPDEPAEDEDEGGEPDAAEGGTGQRPNPNQGWRRLVAVCVVAITLCALAGTATAIIAYNHSVTCQQTTSGLEAVLAHPVSGFGPNGNATLNQLPPAVATNIRNVSKLWAKAVESHSGSKFTPAGYTADLTGWSDERQQLLEAALHNEGC